MINLQQRLIIDYSSLKTVAKILTAGQNELILVFFTLAIIFEFFSEWNFAKVIKRILICFVVLTTFGSLLKGSIDLSFGISDNLLDQCKNTEFCSHYLANQKRASQADPLWGETVSLIKNFSSFWLHTLVSLIFKLAFVFTIQIYSLVYAITSVTYPIICSIGILPSPGERAYVGLFQTLLWLFISPIILSIVIVLLASVTEVGIGPKGEVGLEGLLHLMVISLFSVGSLFLSWLICKGEGVAAFGSKMAQMGTTMLGMAGAGGMMGMSRGFGSSFRDIGGMGAGLGKNKIKGFVSEKVSGGMNQKGLEVSPADIANSKNNLMNSPIVPKGSSAYQSLSRGEKFLHKVDSVINARENSMAKQGMIRDFKKIANSPQEAKFKASDYKSNAHQNSLPHKSRDQFPQSSNRQNLTKNSKFKTSPNDDLHKRNVTGARFKNTKNIQPSRHV
jgi:hypothetical protein